MMATSNRDVDGVPAKDDVHQKNTMTETGQARPSGGAPDPVGLAIAKEMQDRMKPAQVILQGSRAAGDHRPDSDVDLMAVCSDHATLWEVDELLRQLLKERHSPPVVNVITITEDEFRSTAPLAQSPAGQAVRHGVTPDGRSLEYRPERDPEPEEVRQEAVFWLALAESYLGRFSDMENQWQAWTHISALEGQTALEHAFKGLLAAGNDVTRFRRDTALMWRHMENTRPITDRNGAQSMEALLATSKEEDGTRCALTRFTEAFRRGDIVPDPTEQERQSLSLYLVPAVNALIDEALARSGATREDLQRELNRRRRPVYSPKDAAPPR